METTFTLSHAPEQDRLFNLVFEKVPVKEGGTLQPHLWTYRSRITLEHLTQTLHQWDMKDKCPILFSFLQEVNLTFLLWASLIITAHAIMFFCFSLILFYQEHNLRATQYLPDIVRLQQCLYDLFHHRLDHREAKTVSIRRFLAEVIQSGKYLQSIGI